jgi:hypothetical protein
MTTQEISPLALDMGPLLQEGQTLVSAACTLTDTSVGSGLVIDLGTDATIDSDIVTQVVHGDLLTAGHVYLLAWIVTISSGTVWEQVTTISVPL